jgi:hypothetical protein
LIFSADIAGRFPFDRISPIPKICRIVSGWEIGTQDLISVFVSEPIVF